MCWNSKFSFLSHAHVFKSLIPALDHHSFTKGKIKCLTTVVARVENRTIFFQPSCVMHRKKVTLFGQSLALFVRWLFYNFYRNLLLLTAANVKEDQQNQKAGNHLHVDYVSDDQLVLAPGYAQRNNSRFWS